ncbi:MAG: hypothetical protein WD295_02920 [Bacteroidota bacterium]
MSIYHESKGSPILKAVIAILLGVLVYVVYEPYQIREKEDRYRRESRARLINIRNAQLQHISEKGLYAPSIDSLVAYIKDRISAGALSGQNFQPLTTGPFVPESLLHTPGSLRPYQVTSVDTTIIKKYVVIDPDGFGRIGSLTDDARVNKASWED